MKKIDEVIREIIRKHNDIIKVNKENGGNKELNYFLDGEIVKQEISQYRDELLDELEEEFDNHYWDSVQKDKEMILLHIKQKFAEMREEKWSLMRAKSGKRWS